MQKIAIFGGTFNPIHWGHLLIAETALFAAKLDRLLWVPTYHPPHKSKTETLLSFDHRFEMVRLAIADHPDFEISAVESERAETSYAIHTLKALQILHPNTRWYWIIGLDAFQTLPLWYARQELAETCCWLVASRPKQTVEEQKLATAETVCAQVAHQLATQSIKLQWQILQMPLIGISSSLVREYCRQQHSIRYLVPESVRAYILAQGLFRGNG